MKYLYTILVLSFLAPWSIFKSTAQTKEQIQLDTIYTNNRKNIALFFPSPIRQGIVGAEHFVFTYNREKEQHFGLLQAHPGPESNLLVIDTNGSVYSFVISYKEHLQQVNHFFNSTDKIGNEKPIQKDTPQLANQKTKEKEKRDFYQKLSASLLNKAQKIGNIKKTKYNISLQIKNIVFNTDELYFIIQIKNNSSLDYDLGFLELYQETRKKGKKKSLQRLESPPLYTYKNPERINGHSAAIMVYVYSKFSIDKDHRAILKLGELNGQRNVTLKIPKRFVNNPN